jgi:hypothetical protein
VVERRRWDIDERFVGVADATATSPDIERLLAQSREPGWITEDAEAHLGSHLISAAGPLGLVVRRLEVIDAVLEIDVAATGDDDWRATRVAAFALIGAVAEGSTHVRELSPGRDGLDLAVLTGVLPGDSTFATHGHLLRIRVVPGA